MPSIIDLPEDTQLITCIVDVVHIVPGIAAITLGGSRARGTAHASSDYDIGLYYDAASPIDTAALGEVARKLDDRGAAAGVTPVGGWGPRIDGGGWLVVGGRHVDLLYRSLDRVAAAIDEAHRGEVAIDYQPGHPHGFVSVTYVGEVAEAKILSDPHGRLAALKARCRPYPRALRDALVAKFLWEARFALENAAKAVPRGDLAYLAGSGFRATACLAQVLFALNGAYLLNEKGAIALAAGFPLTPPDLERRVNGAVVRLAAEPADGLAALFALAAEVESVAGHSSL